MPAAWNGGLPKSIKVHGIVVRPTDIFKNRCKFYISHKGRNDVRHAIDRTKRSIPVISFDFSYTGRNEKLKGQEDASKNKLICLVLHDLQSG